MKARVKRMLRRLVPDRVMARYRLLQHSRHVRTNLVLFVDDPAEARRWVRTTPDTVQVRRRSSSGNSHGAVALLGDPVDGLAEYLSDDIPAVVAGRLGRPRLRGGRRALPRVQGVSAVVDQQVAAALDLTDGISATEAFRRLVDAGYVVGVVPVDRGTPRRLPAVEIPSIVIVSAVPMHDVGGGSRTAQLALEFLRQGFQVTYVSLFPAAESVDLGLRFVHPSLEQWALGEFDLANHFARVRQPTICLVALPSRPAVELGIAMADHGYRLVYDLIDDWSDPALGAEWYAKESEDRLIDHASLLTGSAPDLVAALERRGRPALLVPNAVNHEIFSVDPGPRPDDMPDGPVLGYHGSLYGSWFDWDALSRVADANPDTIVVVIGDIPARHPSIPDNVRLLGLKAQTSLPGYVGRFSVGLLPFHVTETTHAVSPLKVFEYLAMGVPVAAPPLRALEGLDGVHVAPDLVEAVARALNGPRPDRSVALERHSWAERVRVLLSHAGIEPPGGGHSASTEFRPPIHHPAADRLM